MIKKVLTVICKFAMVIGSVVILGSAGASDLETATFTNIVIKAVIGLFIVLAGYIGLISIDRSYIGTKE